MPVTVRLIVFLEPKGSLNVSHLILMTGKTQPIIIAKNSITQKTFTRVTFSGLSGDKKRCIFCGTFGCIMLFEEKFSLLIKLERRKLYLLVYEERDILFDLELFPQDILHGGWVTKTMQWNAWLSGWVFRKMKGYYVRIWSPLGIQQEEIGLICRRKNLGYIQILSVLIISKITAQERLNDTFLRRSVKL